MALRRLDPERRRKRLALLAELTGSRAHRERMDPQRTQAVRLRELIAVRRRLAG